MTFGPRSYIFMSVGMGAFGAIRSAMGESSSFSLFMAIWFMAFAVWKLVPAIRDDEAGK